MCGRRLSNNTGETRGQRQPRMKIVLSRGSISAGTKPTGGQSGTNAGGRFGAVTSGNGWLAGPCGGAMPPAVQHVFQILLKSSLLKRQPRRQASAANIATGLQKNPHDTLRDLRPPALRPQERQSGPVRWPSVCGQDGCRAVDPRCGVDAGGGGHDLAGPMELLDERSRP